MVTRLILFIVVVFNLKNIDRIINEFNRDDQKRLAIYLTKKTKAKWMLVIKSTDFIKSLYSCDSLTIEEVDKKYNVSFMDRNNKDVIHLIIRNYK